MDAMKEATISLRAVKLCAAGYLTGNEQLLERGKQAAAKIDEAAVKALVAPLRRPQPTGPGDRQYLEAAAAPLDDAAFDDNTDSGQPTKREFTFAAHVSKSMATQCWLALTLAPAHQWYPSTRSAVWD